MPVKSICYQVPALLLPGITLVVSPLVSLMKDQVGALVQAGVAAAFLNNSLTDNQKALMLHRAREGWYKIIYVAPERLEMPGFQRFVQEQQISMVTVDEAHCISQWGQDFRPSYLRIQAFVDSLPTRPVVGAFTATATAHVRDDIRTHLALRDPYEVTASFDRPNLYFATQRALPSEKAPRLLELVLQEGNNAGIVYCSTTKQVDETCPPAAEPGHPGGGLPRQAGRRHPPQESGRFPLRPGAGDGGHQCLSAWASTSPTCGSSSIIICPRTWRAIIRRPAVPGATVSPSRCTLLYSGTDVRTIRFFIDKELEADNGLPADVKAEAARKARGTAQVYDLLFHHPEVPAGLSAAILRGGRTRKSAATAPAVLAAEQEAQLQLETPGGVRPTTPTGWKSPAAPSPPPGPPRSARPTKSC